MGLGEKNVLQLLYELFVLKRDALIQSERWAVCAGSWKQLADIVGQRSTKRIVRERRATEK